jgi:hypothetical protein
MKRFQPSRQLLQALDAVSRAGCDLDAAVDGVTDQFDLERRRLRKALARADRALAKAKGGAA